MSAVDYFEWIRFLMIPMAVIALFFLVITSLYVYFDAEKRSGSRLFSVILTVSLALSHWPISFLVYLACTAILDRRWKTDDLERLTK
ncbi:MAG TPA: hypothetical protein VNQ76_12695 [Planctomicrobium sp.]|nr:hypothetical protein [Planctomicrobium sp.]